MSPPCHPWWHLTSLEEPNQLVDLGIPPTEGRLGRVDAHARRGKCSPPGVMSRGVVQVCRVHVSGTLKGSVTDRPG